MKYIAIIAIAIAATGCRGLVTSSNVTNNFTSGRDTVLTKSGTTGANEATQAADKKLGDIAPKANVAAGPASKVDATPEPSPAE